jgi:hypothetical protein
MGAVREMQTFQDAPGSITVKVVTIDAERFDVSSYADRMRRKVQGRLSIDVKIVDAIEPTARGKRRYIDQRLDFSRVLREKAVHFNAD